MADDGGNQIEQQLKEMFPAQSDAKIALAVQQSNQDLSLAIELLLSGVLNEEEEQDVLLFYLDFRFFWFKDFFFSGKSGKS